ncbi:MAG: hypothetical protein ACOC97_03915 [Myxococcota bacterium]
MRLQTLTLAAAVAAAIAGGVVLVDALVTTDEERLERFVETVTSPVNAATLREGLAWVDPAVQPLEVEARGMGRLYDARNAESLEPDARRGLEPYMGDHPRALRESIQVEGDRGTVDLQLLTGRGMVEARFRFRRRGERWLLEKAEIR